MSSGWRIAAASALLAAAAWADAHSLGVVAWLDRCSAPVASLPQAMALWFELLGQVWTWSFLAMGLLCLGPPSLTEGAHGAEHGRPGSSRALDLAVMWLTMPVWCVLSAQLAGTGDGPAKPIVFTLTMAFGGMLAPMAWRQLRAAAAHRAATAARC